MKKIQICIVFIAIVFLHINLFSQDEYIEKYSDREIEEMKADLLKKPLNGFFGLCFTNMVPQNEFMDNIHRTGQGLSLYGGWHFDPFPVAVGLQTDVVFNGSDERVFHVPTSFDYEDTLTTQSMIVPISLFFRLQPEVLGFIDPYLDFYGGINIFSYSVSYDEEDEYPDPKDYLNASWNWGIGAGLMLKIADFFSYPDKRSSFLFDMRIRYMRGGTTKYYTGRIDGLTVKIKEYESNTNMILFHAGFSFRF